MSVKSELKYNNCIQANELKNVVFEEAAVNSDLNMLAYSPQGCVSTFQKLKFPTY